EVAGKPRLPSAAMHEHMHWRVRRFGGEDVHSLDCGRAISEALRSAEPLAHEFAVAGATLHDSLDIRRIDPLIVSVIELFLVHVEPDQWPFRAHCRRGLRPCNTRDSRDNGSARGQMQKLSTVGKFHDVFSEKH